MFLQAFFEQMVMELYDVSVTTSYDYMIMSHDL